MRAAPANPDGHGGLANLRHEVSRTSIARVLQGAGLEPAPGRKQGMTWKEFLKTHRDALAATDLFTVELWTTKGLIRYHVLFVIKLATQEVQIAGIVPEPWESWMGQMARNLTDPWTGFLRSSRWRIHDRSTLFSEHFRQLLRSARVKGLRLPARSPNLNAYAERFVRSEFWDTMWLEDWQPIHSLGGSAFNAKSRMVSKHWLPRCREHWFQIYREKNRPVGERLRA